MGLTISGKGETGWSYNGKPGYKFHSKNGVAGFMLPGDESSWVPAKAKGAADVKTGKQDPMAPPKPPETPSAPTRDTPAPNGGSGSGTRTSPGGNGPINMTAADAARFYQSRGIGGFSSNQLPTTNTNPFSGGTIEAVPFGGQEVSVTTNTLGAFTANGQPYAALDPTGAGANFNPQAGKIAGGAVDIGQAANPGPKATGKISSSKLSEALNDKAGFQASMSKYGSPEQDQMRAANMAFLNTDGSMKGLQAKEQVLNQMYAGGQTYQLNADGSDFLKNKEGKNIAADKDAKRAYMSGNMTAANYKDTFKGAVMQAVAQTPVIAKQAENPTAQNPVPVSKQPTNTNFGPLMDGEQTGRMLESLKGMKGIGPFVDGPTYGEFLEGQKARPEQVQTQSSNSVLPIAVDMNDIPKELNSPEGLKYLADLQAGKLTRQNPYSK